MFFCYLNQCIQELQDQRLQPYPYFLTETLLSPKPEEKNHQSIQEKWRVLEISGQKKVEEESQEPKIKLEQEIVPNNPKKIKKEKKVMEEEQYNPEQEQAKKSKKTTQNIKRNIIPNIIHQIFCFLQKRSRSESIVKRYFQIAYAKLCNEFEIAAKIKRFYNYQKLFREKTNSYINSKGLKELNKYQEPSFDVYSKSEQDEFLQLNRILIRHFLEGEINLVVGTSLRMKGRSRQYYLQAKRKILTILEYDNTQN